MARRSCLLGCAGVAIACYALSWPLSNGIGYSYWTEFTYQQTAPASIHGVDIDFALNTSTHSSSRNWLCPLMFHGESKGPYVAVLRLDDAEMRAKSFRINSAQIQAEDGTAIQLGLVREDSQTPDARWHPFFENASSWIGHVHHEGKLALDGPVTLHLDISVEKDGVQHQQVFNIRMIPTVDRHQGMVSI
jgi:hypothetical protein